MSTKKVIIIGGGVAGMSAAHELVERGFEVEVYERQKIYVGGKARSVDVPGTNLIHADKYLPGEHGFRFFPGFYKHITDTMKRIPFTDKNGIQHKNGCFDNLVPTSRIMLAIYGKDPIVMPASFPKNKSDIKLMIHDLFDQHELGLSQEEIDFFVARIWQCMTSCAFRRDGEYERISWWEFMQAERFSDAYRHLLVEGLTRSLVAARAEVASMKTGTNVTLQLMFCMWDPSVNTDRVLNGPTNDVWLFPWLKYLTGKGIKFYHGYRGEEVIYESGIVRGIKVSDPDGKEQVVAGDLYILATPVERTIKMIPESMVQNDPSLTGLNTLAESTSWMNGIQYYLNEDVSINKGHVCYSYTEWAVTSISQIQFWKDYDLGDRFNGKIKGILSVDISDWLYTKFNGRLAENCTAEEVMKYTWEQIKMSLNVNGKVLLRDDMIDHWYLDRDIHKATAQVQAIDKEPLLINAVNTWALRPMARTRIQNFYLASDYVRTNTDLATMEGANEAARRAVNSILADSGSDASPCTIWPLHEPAIFLPLKWWDNKRYQQGLPWSDKSPGWLKMFMVVWTITYIAFTVVRSFFKRLFGSIS
ncbi:MAG: NAD(P)-binding protein [Sphingobacteriales bacterium]|jgi:uncharacterized protein with NAD-binding domain and iron-sulfur cluster|nr:NAD(P)-binding protein [Sphingobacteriales bacterium]